MLEHAQYILVGVTRDCNLRCQYCFETNKDAYRGKRMSLECFRKFLDKLAQDRRRSIHLPPRVCFCFHGGEPTLAGRPLIKSFIDETKLRLGADVEFTMQSNGLLLDEEWLSFAEQNQIHIGVSLDGSDYKANRLRFADKKQFKKYKKSWRGLLPKVGVLAVLSKNNLATLPVFLFYLFFKYGRNSARVSLAEIIDDRLCQDEDLSGVILAQKFYILMLRLLMFCPVIQEANILDFLERFFVNYIYTKIADPNTVDYASRLCSAKFCSSGNSIIAVQPDGGISACQRSMSAADYQLGSIYDDTPDLFGLFSFQKLLALSLRMAQELRVKRCDTCFAADICGYGCRVFALLKTKGAEAIREDQVCALYKILRKYLGRDIYNNLLLYALLRNYPVEKQKKSVQITIPLNARLDNGCYRVTTLRDRNIQVWSGDSTQTCVIAFAMHKLNIVNYVRISARSWLKKKPQRSENECYSDH
jgi:radical SAM protein with 4Fe4S-binding SPASM domain